MTCRCAALSASLRWTSASNSAFERVDGATPSAMARARTARGGQARSGAVRRGQARSGTQARGQRHSHRHRN
eukprot:6196770-Pleurochrysis_carterae.AAC.4